MPFLVIVDLSGRTHESVSVYLHFYSCISIQLRVRCLDGSFFYFGKFNIRELCLSAAKSLSFIRNRSIIYLITIFDSPAERFELATSRFTSTPPPHHAAALSIRLHWDENHDHVWGVQRQNRWNRSIQRSRNRLRYLITLISLTH